MVEFHNKAKIAFQDIHHTREFKKKFLSSFSDAIDRLVICSPYIGKLFKPFNDIFEFCRQQKLRGTREIQLITSPPRTGSDSSISKEVANNLALEGVEIFFRSSPTLHAKLYHFDYDKGYFRSFVGSSNFSLGGFENNYELVAEIEGVGVDTPFHREINRLMGPGALPYQNWVENTSLKKEVNS